MYDSAKRGLACTVATGGLLLTGAAYSPAMAATADSAPSGGAGAASAASAITGSPGLLSGNDLRLPLNLGLDLCGDSVQVASAFDTSGGSRCGASSGAAATGSTADSGGVLAGNTIQIPINAPILACGNDVTVLGYRDTAGGSTCAPDAGTTASTGGAHATGSTADSGGVLAGNTIQIPINAPVIVCGNSVGAAAADDTHQGSTCTTAEGGAGTGAGVTAGSTGNGGVVSGETVQLPVNAPVLVCGNAVDALDLLDSVLGGTCGATAATPLTPTTLISVPPGTPGADSSQARPNSALIGLAAHPDPVGTGRHRAGALATTGANVDGPLGVAGAAVAAGLGLQVLGRRRKVRG